MVDNLSVVVAIISFPLNAHLSFPCLLLIVRFVVFLNASFHLFWSSKIRFSNTKPKIIGINSNIGPQILTIIDTMSLTITEETILSNNCLIIIQYFFLFH